MTGSGIVATLASLREVFGNLEVEWAIGGSLASTRYGEPRATNDIDIVAALDGGAVPALVKAATGRFYMDADMVREAVADNASFNLLDEETFVKIDVFVPAPSALGLGQLTRRRWLSLFDMAEAVPLIGPEDTVLQKLRWYDLGGGVSERQWRDIVSVLRAQRGQLDCAYLTSTAEDAGYAPLLDRARQEASGTA